jgi:hypothetical protein
MNSAETASNFTDHDTVVYLRRSPAALTGAPFVRDVFWPSLISESSSLLNCSRERGLLEERWLHLVL